jgi:hypothetical protein
VGANLAKSIARILEKSRRASAKHRNSKAILGTYKFFSVFPTAFEPAG